MRLPNGEVKISIHAPRTGSDAELNKSESMRGISIHAPRTGSDLINEVLTYISVISIHAPRTGSDFSWGCTSNCMGYFNPRSPHGERRARKSKRALPCYFNPRSPHGERRELRNQARSEAHFNPRSPHGERLVARERCAACRCISIHAPRTGSDKQRIAYFSS